ncbi:MAG: hypothetical protein AAB036_09690 [Elusimicrobiota bacterium]
MRAHRGVWGFVLIAAAYAGAFSLAKFWMRGAAEVRLGAARPEYFHYDIVELVLRTRERELDASFLEAPPRLFVERGGEPVTTIAGVREMTMARVSGGVWIARWPVPWNAPSGEYRPRLIGRPEIAQRLVVSPFRIARRAPQPMPRGLVVATLESGAPLESMRVKGPDGLETDWRGLLDWARWIGADAFWMLGGQSPGHGEDDIWLKTNLNMIPSVASECRKRGLKFGVYVMYSLTTAKKMMPGYEYGVEIQDSRPVATRAISIGDRKRLDDVAAFLRPFAADPNVDYIGLDYIRNALGGYELVDDFVAEMPGLTLPPEWPKLTRAERMVWLARKKIMRRDADFVEAWQWWRARRVALIVRELKARLGDKPMWAFTLTWEKGWHHGQDPVMMNDAGIDIDALMFYEADKVQYAEMMESWNGYVKRGDVQLLPGNIFDWGLHQKDSKGPGEFSRRLKTAVKSVYSDGPARGVFFHDVSRLCWGRLGKWGTAGWAQEARQTAAFVKSLSASEMEK